MESLPSSAEWTPEQVRQGLTHVGRGAVQSLRALGVTAADARDRVGICYMRGNLIVWNVPTKRRRLRKGVQPLLVILELVRHGCWWLKDGLMKDATRALSDARAIMATAPYQKGQSKGGDAPKRLPGIWQRVRELVTGNPQVTTKQAWESFPEARQAEAAHIDGRDIEALIYRDGNDLVEVEDRTGRVRDITYDSFRGYLKAARKERQVSSK